MSDETPVEVAAKRLQSAIEALEIATKRRSVSDGAIQNLQGEIQALTDDRSKLAQDLDEVRARNAQLERISDEVSKRMDRAIEAFEGVLDKG